MKNKFLSVILTIAFWAQAVVFAENATFTPTIIPAEVHRGLTLIDEKTVAYVDGFEQPNNYITYPPTLLTTPSTNLPSKYDSHELGYITPVRNQNPYGTCWAFSLISAMETSMIKKGLANVDEVDYSEKHLAYFAHTQNSFTGDGQTIYDDEYGYYGGGNQILGSQYLAGWQGVATEEDFPYPPSGMSEIIDESYRYTSEAHLQDYYELEADYVKSAIMEYGSVICGYYDIDDCHTSTNAYYQNQYTGSNHAVTIVGWDDNYALSNFDGLPATPSAPGAWKIKNSWGPSWGDNGYFWLSYEDPSLANFVAVNAEPADNYQVIHQYDGASNHYIVGAAKIANIFTAQETQTIQAVGFYTNHYNHTPAQITYTASVYLLNSDYTSPEDGTPVSTKTGTVEHTGYHTIELDTPVIANAGQHFSVVLTLKYSQSEYAYYVFEGPEPYAVSNIGESFCFNGVEWSDAGSQFNNACIKAYATVDPVTVTFNTNGGNSIASVDVQKNSLLTIPQAPTKTNSYFAGWYKDAQLTLEWDFENDIIIEDTTLYAKWSATPIKASSITITGDDLVYVGYTSTLTAKIEPYYTTDQTITWSSSGAGATVENGVVTGVSSGIYTIRASLADDTYDTYNIKVKEPIFIMTVPNLPVINSSVISAWTDLYYSIYAPLAEHVTFFLQTPAGTIKFTNLEPTVKFSIDGFSYPEGEYRFYVHAYDSAGNYTVSETIPFWVTDNPILIAAPQPQSLRFGAYNGNSDSQLILACYNAGRLEKTELYNEGVWDNLHSLPYDYSYDEVKLFWWDSLSGMTPITDPITITRYDGQPKAAQ